MRRPGSLLCASLLAASLGALPGAAGCDDSAEVNPGAHAASAERPAPGEEAPGGAGSWPLEAEAEVAKGPPPLPQAPSLSDLLDAGMGGPVKLPDALAERLRRAQHAAGERPAILRDVAWAGEIEALLTAVDELPTHGVRVGTEARLLASELAELREAIVFHGDWSGDERADREHARHVVHADFAAAKLWLLLARKMSGDRALVPASVEDVRARLLDAATVWDLDVLLASLAPSIPQYERLRQALKRYRDIEEAGGFSPVPEGIGKARPKRDNDAIGALKARLSEELPPGEAIALTESDMERWDEALTTALEDARERYQLRRKRGRKLIDDTLLSALAVPVSERIQTLELNLERLRRSALNDHDYKVYVNLPDYHGEVWDGPERLLRFKIVIGSTRREKGRMVNATPTLSSRIHRIIYNPWWNVPKRIFEDELKPAATKWARKKAEAAAAAEGGDPGGEGTLVSAAPAPTPSPAVAEPSGADEGPVDPAMRSGYWEDKGFVVMGGEKRQWVRRKPGPGNALGKVKFIFENRHAVFLHDTPAKKKFRAVRRSFSHGCMRVGRPLDLAQLLLERDGTWHVAERKRVMKHYKNAPITLNTPVPIVVDYVTARVDDEGRVHWLHDVYKKDRLALATR